MTGARERFVAMLRARQGERTQAELARELMVDEATISRYLKGSRPSATNARRIARRWPELQDVLTTFLFWEEGTAS